MPQKFFKALVTGGSSGLGRALVAQLRVSGCGVCVVSRRAEGLPAGVEHLAADLADEEALKAVEERTAAGGFDLVINAAGAGECVSLDEITPAQARRAWVLMVEAPRRISRAAIPGLLKNKGALVNVSSMAADFPLPYMPLYNICKSACSALSQSLRDEYPSLQVVDLKPGDLKTGFAAGWKISEGRPYTATARHLKEMIDQAPRPEAYARKLLRELCRGRRGILRVGTFLQTVLMPLGARLIPGEWMHAARRAYLKR